MDAGQPDSHDDPRPAGRSRDAHPRAQLRETAKLAAIFCLLLVGGMWLGGHNGWMSSGLRSVLASQSSSQQRLQTVLDMINSEYYRKVDDKQLVDAGLTGLVESLDDPYSHYYTPSLYKSFLSETDSQVTGIGVEIGPKLVDGGLEILGVEPGSPASRAHLRRGDIIYTVNGQAIKTLGVDAGANLIKGNPGTAVTLAVGRHGVTHEVKIVRRVVTFPVVSSRMIDDDGVKLAYVDLSQFASNCDVEVRDAVDKLIGKGARGVILDLRDNPGGLLIEAVRTASIFIPKGEVVVSTRGRDQTPAVYDAVGDPISAAIPVTVLVNRDTASAAEIVTAALQDHKRATVIGTHTYGKGVFQQIFPLSWGGALDITVGEFFTPNGHNLGGTGVARGLDLTRGAGVTPNIYVYDNPEDPGTAVVKKAEQVLSAELK